MIVGRVFQAKGEGPHPTIYLRGVNEEELKSLLRLSYFGVVSFGGDSLALERFVEMITKFDDSRLKSLDKTANRGDSLHKSNHAESINHAVHFTGPVHFSIL